MSTVPTTVSLAAAVEPAERRRPVLRAVLASGVVAAGATTAIAAAADAAGVPLAIDGERIPVAGFAQLTVIGAMLGGAIVAVLNRFGTRSGRQFTTVAMALTALSCIPSLALPPDVATKLVLVATHLVAAAIIVPALVHQTR